MPDRSHLSIGEVLSLLRDEFPDVTISKIRFLESQGLVDPERTPSGYRKFYEHDVDRLRWILRQQRENFLPLKVIKGRLTDQDDDDSAALEGAELDLNGSGASAEAVPEGPDAVPVASTGRDSATSGAETDPSPGDHPERGPVPVPGPGGPSDRVVTGSSDGGGRSERAVTGASGRHAAGILDPLTTEADRGQDAVPAGAAGPAGPAVAPAPVGAAERITPQAADRTPLPAGEEDDSFTLEELMARSGLDKAQVDELTRFGLISPASSSGGERYYDADAVAIATVAAGFARHGVEARHLRGWRTSAEREVSLFEQVVVPLLRQRNPQARNQAAVTLDELADLGASLRQVLVRRALGEVH